MHRRSLMAGALATGLATAAVPWTRAEADCFVECDTAYVAFELVELRLVEPSGAAWSGEGPTIPESGGVDGDGWVWFEDGSWLDTLPEGEVFE